MADHLGAAYLRYSFTKGTPQEVDFLVDELALEPGHRVLDVGCGPGRHSHELARRGIEVVGLDIAERFVELARADAPAGATFVRGDATTMTFDSEFDAVISLCQGAFGLAGDDGAVLAGIHRALRPGGRLALSAFSAYFQVRWLEDTDTFDAATGVNHETTEIRDESGTSRPTDLWTTCATPRELRLLVERAGLVVDHIWSVEPGRYRRRPPTIDTPEFLVVGSLR
jgi:SAM-dependent methyltransferase